MHFVDHAVAQLADAFRFDFDDIAGHKIPRRIEPRAGAGRRSRHDDIAGHQRGEGRDVVDQIAEAENQPAGAVVLAQFAVDARREPDVGDLGFIGVGHQPRAEAAGGIEILALGDVEFRVPHPVADGAFVAEADRGDVVQRRAFRDVAAGLADNQNHFALVVELRRGARANQRRPMTDEGARRAHEHARIFRRVLAVLVFGVAVRIVDADADDLFRRGNRRLPGDGVEREVGRMARGFVREFRQRTGSDDFAQRRIFLCKPRGEIDDAAIGDEAVFGRAVDGEGREARRR